VRRKVAELSDVREERKKNIGTVSKDQRE